MADLQITGLVSLNEASIAPDDELAVADVSQTETKKVTVKDLVNAVVTASGTSFLADGAIPGAKIGTLGTGLVDTATIIDNKVTNVKIETSTSATTGIDGGQKLRDGTVTVAKLDSTKFDRGLSVASAKLGIANSITAGTKSGITYTDQGLISGVADLVATDLPEATSSAIGAVKVESGSLLEVSNTGAIDIKDVSGLSAGTYASVTVNAKGQVTSGSTSASATTIPAATTTVKGGVIVPTSGGLAVDANGNLSIATQGSVSAGDYAKVTVNTKGIVTGTGTLAAADIPDHSAAKLTSGTIPAARIGSSAINADRLDAGAVTNDKVETSTSNSTGLDGSTKLRDGTITAAKLNTSNIDRSLNVASGNLGINNVITAATRSGITYNAQGLITGTVALAAADLPVATSSAVGGVSVSTGLTVNGSGALSLTNSVTGATVSGITFNNQGMITAATALAATDLPVATTSAKGAVQITSGGGLTVDGSGNLTTSTSGISAGTYQSITVNNKGVATAGAALTAALVPDLAASKITSGTLDAARIGNDTIDGAKLSNASTAIFQSIAQSGYPTAQFSGQILFDTVSEDAFIWDGNAWQAITTLTKGSLVFGGTYNANTSQMVATTSAGIAAGLAVGSNLPSPSSTTDGVYVVVSTSGTPSAPAPAIAFAPPDYILGVTNSAGSSWNEVDLSQTVAGQVASNITFTPYGQLSSTNVQDALQELETEKLALSGGTVTGELLIGNTGSFVFEGSTVDAFETRLTVADPTTSDKVITLPDITGTVITSGDTNTVTSTMVDASLVNANLASGAAIAFSKLAALTSAQILVGNGSNVVTGVAVTGDISINNAGLTAIAAGVIVDADISGSAAITGSKIATGTTSAVGVLQLTDSATSTSATTAATPAAVKIAKDAADAAATTANAALPATGGVLTGHLTLDDEKELRFREEDAGGDHYIALKAAAALAADVTLTLPAVAPTAGQVLKANASTPTTLEWGTDSATDSSKMPLTGGIFNGDVTFTGASADIVFDKSDDAFELEDNAKIKFGTGAGGVPDLNIYSNGTEGILETQDGGTIKIKDGNNTMATFSGASNQLDINVHTIFVGATSNASWDKANDRFSGTITEINVTANNSTDETCYPLFADGATGSQGAETDTGLTYNPSTGLLTSTGFSGSGASLTSLNASNLGSGTVATARLGTGTASSSNYLRGDGSWQAVSSDLVNDTTPQLGGNLDVNGKNIIFDDSSDGATDDVLTFGAGTDLSIYSDGAAGVFQGDIKFKGAGQNILWDNSDNLLWFKTGSSGGQSAKAWWGDGISYGNLEIFMSSGGPAIIQSYNTDLQIASGNSTDLNLLSSKDINFINSTGTTNYYMRCKENSGSDQCVELYYGNTPDKKLETTNTGITVTGTVVATAFTGTASLATEFTVTANNSTDETVYPLFSDGATGSQGAETDTGLTYNPSTGELEAAILKDSKGDLRSIPQNTQASAYELLAADAGKHILASGNITWVDSRHAAGDAITIVNNTAGDITIIKGTTMYNTADGNNANRTLASRGMATILWASGTVAYISGAGLS